MKTLRKTRISREAICSTARSTSDRGMRGTFEFHGNLPRTFFRGRHLKKQRILKMHYRCVAPQQHVLYSTLRTRYSTSQQALYEIKMRKRYRTAVHHSLKFLLQAFTIFVYSAYHTLMNHQELLTLQHTVKDKSKRVKGKVVYHFSPVPKGQLYTVFRQLRGYYDFTDSDRATTPQRLQYFVKPS